MCRDGGIRSIDLRGAELYAQNPNLIKKDENRVHADEEAEEHNQQGLFLPTTEMTTTPNTTTDV